MSKGTKVCKECGSDKFEEVWKVETVRTIQITDGKETVLEVFTQEPDYEYDLPDEVRCRKCEAWA